MMKTIMNARAGALANKQRLLQLILAVMILSGLCTSQAQAQMAGLPTQNKAIYLGWGGYVDTQADFAVFFKSNHTLMTWFMPQYLYAYRGPIFANSGDGTYIFGMEDYRMGDGGAKDAGNPVLMLQVGDQQKLFLVPNLIRNEWHHLAVVRTDNVIKVYMNGVYLQPVKILDKKNNLVESDQDMVVDSSYSPQGTLRFGRKDAGLDTSTQVYGLIDDAAVFDKALTLTEIDSIRNNKKLTGSENGLLLGWSFDQPKKGEPPLSPFIHAPAHLNSRATRVNVSQDRNNTLDGYVYYAQSLLGTVAYPLQLPFKANEAWKVIQGFDSQGGSHNGFAAFSYDFSLATGDGLGYPNGTQFAPIYSASSGDVAFYIKSLIPVGDEKEKNVVFITTAANEFLSYRHNAPETIDFSLDTGDCNPGPGCTFHDNFIPNHVQPGRFVALVGQNAMHLHFGGSNDPNKSGRVTFPVAFENYEMSDDEGAHWTHIDRGYPQKGQWIKRVQ